VDPNPDPNTDRNTAESNGDNSNRHGHACPDARAIRAGTGDATPALRYRYPDPARVDSNGHANAESDADPHADRPTGLLRRLQWRWHRDDCGSEYVRRHSWWGAYPVGLFCL